MSYEQKIRIVNKNGTPVEVTGQNELLVSSKIPATQITSITGSSIVVTPTIVRATTSSSVTAGKSSVSIANVGAANGVVLSQTLKPGESVSFNTSNQSKLSAISYNGTGTELLIITTS